jgi:hypothetical protein
MAIFTAIPPKNVLLVSVSLLSYVTGLFPEYCAHGIPMGVRLADYVTSCSFDVWKVLVLGGVGLSAI